MNLLNEFTKKELNLLEEIGVHIENKEYSKNEIRKCEIDIEDYIMLHSSKNNDIAENLFKFNEILNKIISYE